MPHMTNASLSCIMLGCLQLSPLARVSVKSCNNEISKKVRQRKLHLSSKLNTHTNTKKKQPKGLAQPFVTSVFGKPQGEMHLLMSEARKRCPYASLGTCSCSLWISRVRDINQLEIIKEAQGEVEETLNAWDSDLLKGVRDSKN